MLCSYINRPKNSHTHNCPRWGSDDINKDILPYMVGYNTNRTNLALRLMAHGPHLKVVPPSATNSDFFLGELQIHGLSTWGEKMITAFLVAHPKISNGDHLIPAFTYRSLAGFDVWPHIKLIRNSKKWDKHPGNQTYLHLQM